MSGHLKIGVCSGSKRSNRESVPLKVNGCVTVNDPAVPVTLDEMFQLVGVLTTDGILLECNRAALVAGGLTRDDVYRALN